MSDEGNLRFYQNLNSLKYCELLVIVHTPSRALEKCKTVLTECLRKIVYSSSEDDFIDVNEENEHINLTRRISKMGKIEAKANPAAKKRTKKQPSRREKVIFYF